MANRIFGESRLTLEDGRELTLRFDFGALTEAEEAADKGTEEMIAEMTKGKPRLRTAQGLLYGALRYHHREITMADVGDLLMGEADVPRISEAMAKAMEEMADRRAKANPLNGTVAAPAKPSRGTGTPSSRSGARAA